MSPRRRGFALLAVIWGLGAIAMMVVPFLSASRLRLQSAFNTAAATRAAYIAEAATNLAMVSLLTEFWTGTAHVVHAGERLVCILDDATAGIAIEDESGKVDLNNASPQLLAATLTGFGLSGDTAAVVNGILAFRGPADKVASAADESAYSKSSAKGAPFETALELDQVEGMTPELLRALLPFVTVHSKRPGVNVQAAPPALFAALAGYPIEDVQALLKKPFPNRLDRHDLRHLSEFLSYQQGAGGDTFAVHVEVVLRNGQTGVRDTIVDLNASPQNNFRISEVRRLSPRRWNDLNSLDDPSVLKPCW